MKPYTFERRQGGGVYLVRQFGKGAAQVIRKTKASAGLSYTRSRSKRSSMYVADVFGSDLTERQKTVLALVVFGTLDKLKSGIAFRTTRKQVACRCCGSTTGRLRLNDAGRARLATLRRRKQERQA